MNNELTLDELLKVATDEEQTTVVAKFNKVQDRTILAFIQDFQLEVGDFRVPTYVIYYLYKKYWKRFPQAKLTKVDFFRKFSKEFTLKRKGKQRCYLLKFNGLFLTVLLEAEQFATNQKENSHVRRKSKKIKKSPESNKISGASAKVKP